MADKFAKYFNFGGEDNFYHLPIVTAADNGKVLKVVNGGWRANYLVPPCKIVSWADGTDEEIVTMVEAADAGLINLADYWSVGDTRSVSLPEIYGFYEVQNAQTVEFTLMHAGGYELNTPVASGRTTCSFIVGMKNCMDIKSKLHDTDIGSWNSTLRKAWCNNEFRNAIPSSLRDIFKQFKCITAATYNGTSNETSVDYFTFPAGKEVFGTEYSNGTSYGGGYSNYTEASALFQYDWYKTASNRIKTANGSVSWWWERSPHYNTPLNFCCVDKDGSAKNQYPVYSYGLSPVGCI